MLTYNTIVVLVGAALLGAFAGVVGSFAVLRRRALLGDAMAHAALPGIALGFWITHSKSVPALLLGALATGLVGIWALAVMRRHTRTKEDAALGIVLSVLFGAGVALSRHVSTSVTDGSSAGLDTYILGKTAGIVLSDVVLIGVVAAIALVVVAMYYKQFRLVGFDTEFAQSLGWNTVALDFLVMSLVTAAVVAGLPMVGVVMVAALTILPGVAARLWTDSLAKVLWIAAVFGVIGSTSGVLLSAQYSKLPTGPIVILCMAALFLVSGLFAPNRGFVAQLWRRQSFALERGSLILLRLLQEGNRESDLKKMGVRFPSLTQWYAAKQGWIGAEGLTTQGRAHLEEAQC